LKLDEGMPNKSSNKAKSQRGRERALLQKVHLNAAGIDIGADAHWVAVPEDRDASPVRSFGVFTRDLIALCDWLKRCQVETIVMESTGVYWIPLYQMLERKGFQVRLVNAHHVKNVPGRKTDVKDCQWLQQLHTFGMLGGSFRPQAQMCVVRSYLRLRDTLSKDCNSLVQRMQKALTEMNVQLHRVISDITGVTGMSILRAILAGERDCIKLAQLKHPQIKSSGQDIAKALEGDYCQEHLFALQTALELYDSYQLKIMACDRHIQDALSAFEPKAKAPAPDVNRIRSAEKRQEAFRRHHREEMTGADLTKLPGLDLLAVERILSEIGLDMSRWPSEKHFCAGSMSLLTIALAEAKSFPVNRAKMPIARRRPCAWLLKALCKAKLPSVLLSDALKSVLEHQRPSTQGLTNSPAWFIVCSSLARLTSKPARKLMKSSLENVPSATFSARPANSASKSFP
jgi:transposase